MVTANEKLKTELTRSLGALEKIWDGFTTECEIQVAELKLEHWVTKTEELLSTFGKRKALQSISQMVAQTIQDRDTRFFERVKRYRTFLCGLMKETGEGAVSVSDILCDKELKGARNRE